MTVDGGLNRWEVMNMTNTQRKTWLKQMTARAKRQREASEKATSKGQPPTGPRQ